MTRVPHWGWRIAAALALGINLAVLYAPSVPAPSSGGLRLDLAGHAAIFAALTFTALMARFPLPAVLTVTLANAVASEAVQLWLLPQRSGDWADLLADCLGIALGWALWRALRPRPAPRAAGRSDHRTSSRR